ncbi:MAG: autotransporter domain-containing protein [Pseudolabrys sp.]|nr:autotransporter domain-containing protein [Pseudolabrys sp.]
MHILAGLAVLGALPLLGADEASAVCTAVGTDQTCTNPAGTTLSGGATGLLDFNNLTLTNNGTVAGTSGGIVTFGDANVTNTGAIFGAGTFGMEVFGNANITNSGTIAAGPNGLVAILLLGNTNIVNTGTISGPSAIVGGGFGIIVNITNAGTIMATDIVNGLAIDLTTGTNNTITLLPGSRIIGNIGLGLADTVRIQSGRDISSILSFGFCGCGGLVATGSTAVVLGGSPYVINGDQVAVLDPTAVSLADRTLLDFTGNISSLLASRFGEFGITGSTASAFAPVHSIAGQANDIFAVIPALAYARDDKFPTATAFDRGSGIAVWSKAFAGVRKQDADDVNLAARTIAYGAMAGIDKSVQPDLRLGVFVGAGNGKLDIDLSSQTVKTDYVFGGIYGRFDWTTRFLDFAISAGHTANATTRQIANNLVATGVDTATASYDGWFVSPEIAYGWRIPIMADIVMTPAARLRYLAGFFEGYTETGSAQTLTVSSRTTQNLEERFELAFSRVAPWQQNTLRTTATIGVLGMERIGPTAINAVLIGQTLSFAATGQNSVAGGYARLAADLRIGAATSLFAAIEGTVMSDHSRTGIAQGGVKVAF